MLPPQNCVHQVIFFRSRPIIQKLLGVQISNHLQNPIVVAHVIADESDCVHMQSERALSGSMYHVIKYVSSRGFHTRRFFIGSAGSESKSFFEPLGSTDLLLRRSGQFDSQNLEIFRQTSLSLNEKNETYMKLSKHTSKNLDYHLFFRTFYGSFLSQNLWIRIEKSKESETPA